MIPRTSENDGMPRGMEIWIPILIEVSIGDGKAVLVTEQWGIHLPSRSFVVDKTHKHAVLHRFVVDFCCMSSRRLCSSSESLISQCTGFTLIPVVVGHGSSSPADF